MNKEKRRVPKLRFPGFTEDWEQRKLGDLLILLKDGSHGTHKNTDEGVYLLSAKNIKNGQINIMPDDRIISWEDYDVIHKNYELQFGDILLTIVGSIGETAIYNLKTKVTFQRSVAFLRPSSDLNNGFLYTLINTDSFQNQLQTKQVVSAQPGIYLGDLASIDIIYPKNLSEQEKIYSIFKEIENSITLHQRKLEHLILKKKALLQKLFPKNGERYPELRFSEFTDAWEQRKLGECMNSFAYGLNAAAKDYDGMHKYIRITDIDDETHNFIQSNLTSPDIDFNMDVSDYKLNVGDIVFARTGASVGKTYLYNPNDGDLYYAGFLIRGEVKEDCDAGFIYQNTLTKEYDSFIRITSQRSGQPGVNSKEYATFKLNIPCKDEQEKISKVLNSLDELYTLHQRKLEHLQLQKKALLQQMFV